MRGQYVIYTIIITRIESDPYKVLVFGFVHSTILHKARIPENNRKGKARRCHNTIYTIITNIYIHLNRLRILRLGMRLPVLLYTNHKYTPREIIAM